MCKDSPAVFFVLLQGVVALQHWYFGRWRANDRRQIGRLAFAI
jgi:hypothetical protein